MEYLATMDQYADQITKLQTKVQELQQKLDTQPFKTATIIDNHIIVKGDGPLDPSGEGPNMHLGLPCSNADEVRKLEASWKAFEARGYSN